MKDLWPIKTYFRGCKQKLLNGIGLINNLNYYLSAQIVLKITSIFL